jgi:hypothetical protein
VDYSAATTKIAELGRKGGLNDRSVNGFDPNATLSVTAAALANFAKTPVAGVTSFNPKGGVTFDARSYLAYDKSAEIAVAAVGATVHLRGLHHDPDGVLRGGQLSLDERLQQQRGDSPDPRKHARSSSLDRSNLPANVLRDPGEPIRGGGQCHGRNEAREDKTGAHHGVRSSGVTSGGILLPFTCDRMSRHPFSRRRAAWV